MSQRPNALLFDLGKVCLPFDHGRMVSQLAELFGVPTADVQTALLDGETLSDIERGQISDDALHRMLCNSFGRDLPAADVFEAASDIFTADEAMNQLLAELAAIDLPLILVSNTSGPHIDFVRREFDILDHFDELILSYAIKAAKPETAFYEAAFAVAKCPPSECFYTDDIPEYVAAAQSLGVDAEVFTGADTLRQQLTDRGVL